METEKLERGRTSSQTNRTHKKAEALIDDGTGRKDFAKESKQPKVAKFPRRNASTKVFVIFHRTFLVDVIALGPVENSFAMQRPARICVHIVFFFDGKRQ